MTTKILPGVYVNFVSNKQLAIDSGERGVVLLPLELPYGNKGEVVEVSWGDDTRMALGQRYDEILPVKEALKCSQKVLVCKVNGGTKASTQLTGGLTVTAAKEGSLGNHLALRVEPLGESFQVVTTLDGAQVDIQTLKTAADWKDNGYVTLSGEGTLQESAGALEGGTDEEAQKADYQQALAQAVGLDFTNVACVSDDSEVKQLFVDFAAQMREEEGRKIQAVVANVEADTEGVISVGNGVVLEDGTQVTPELACAFVAGMEAGATVSESCTNKTYPGAAKVDKVLSRKEKEEAVEKGQLIFTENRAGKVTVLYDINSLTSFTVDKSKDFSKNRVMRVLDGIHNDVVAIFETGYMGKIGNDQNGRSLLRGSLIEYFNELQNKGAIHDFSAEDVTVAEGSDADSVIITVQVSPVDSCEKFYITVNVA